MEDFSKRVKIPADVLIREVGDEVVILNLNTKQYYSLDEIGKSMLQALNTSASMEQAISHLMGEYDVDQAVLRADLQELIANLLMRGLVEIA